MLKKAIMTAPVLAYPDPNKEYLLVTDASKLGLGRVLSRNSQMVGTIPWPSVAETCEELSTSTIVLNLSFSP